MDDLEVATTNRVKFLAEEQATIDRINKSLSEQNRLRAEDAK